MNGQRYFFMKNIILTTNLSIFTHDLECITRKPHLINILILG